MKCSLLLAFVFTLLAANAAFAGRYGSETAVTLSGTFHLKGADVTTTLKNNDVRTTSSYVIKQVTNRLVLDAMKKRDLIPTVTGYSLVMVGQTHMADATRFFVIRGKELPIPVPEDILNLDVNDGPSQGTVVVSPQSTLKTWASETRNYARLNVGIFEGAGILTQTWRSTPYTKAGVTEVVELVTANGSLSGTVTGDNNSGVGVIKFTLSGSKVVDLTHYGMVAETSSVDSGSFGITPAIRRDDSYGGVLVLGLGGLTHHYPGASVINGSSFVLNGGPVDSPPSNLMVGGISTIPGITLAFNGTVLTTQVFSANPANELTITTANGPVVFTRESDNVWTPVVPAP